MGFRFLDHTADIGIEVEADDVSGLFAEAALAFADCITELESLDETLLREIRLTAATRELLLVDWLNELLYIFEASGELFRAFECEVREAGAGWEIVAQARGAKFDDKVHRLKVPIKAVTYHGLEVGRDGNAWRARVIFDI